MKHLTVEQRYNIFAYKQAGIPQNKIARIIGVHPSTVSREIKRNADQRNGVYRPELAQRKYVGRLKSRKHFLKLKGDILNDVDNYLLNDLSPEQITGRLRSEGKESVSHETIYLYV